MMGHINNHALSIFVSPFLEWPWQKREPFRWTPGRLLSDARDDRGRSGRTSCCPVHDSARMVLVLQPDSDRMDWPAPPDSPKRPPLPIRRDRQAWVAGRGWPVAVTDR